MNYLIISIKIIHTISFDPAFPLPSIYSQISLQMCTKKTLRRLFRFIATSCSDHNPGTRWPLRGHGWPRSGRSAGWLGGVASRMGNTMSTEERPTTASMNQIKKLFLIIVWWFSQRHRVPTVQWYTSFPPRECVLQVVELDMLEHRSQFHGVLYQMTGRGMKNICKKDLLLEVTLHPEAPPRREIAPTGSSMLFFLESNKNCSDGVWRYLNMWIIFMRKFLK